ncbi:Rha family transcriptional regulator [Vagococcus fluvialis]|uniref:Rha family transcriptional regulator n=1 Tax=Vagococcus fluvialis TaxID=2738 RepID=UPI001D0B6921|nr:Rha family transcriptional regulator [Vagococcus fluvialis]UDM70703.1 Rha family transcriptional regulator [Vagococcus fluvialis]UDM78122.1 Rha family transcriptional regulator [Vagococcus fluvialis]UDM82391.1 Rha family transcriptional regulator [Vagococcus fluvialis]
MNLVQIENNQPVTSSLQVAERFNKQHKHVLEAIDDLVRVVENSADLFYEDTYIHPQNKQEYRQIIMNKKGWTLVAMGFTGKKATHFKLDYINAFDEMEEMLKKSQPKLPTDPMEILKLTFEAQEQTNERVEAVEKEVKDLKDNQKIAADDYGYISRRVNQRVSEVAKGFGKLTNEQRGKLFKDINTGIKQVTGVGSRSQIREKHYEMVVEFIQDWEPSTATKTIVRQMSLDLDDIA